MSSCCILGIDRTPSSELQSKEPLSSCSRARALPASPLWRREAWGSGVTVQFFEVLLVFEWLFLFCVRRGLLEADGAHVIEDGIAVHFCALDTEFGFERSFFVMLLGHQDEYN